MSMYYITEYIIVYSRIFHVLTFYVLWLVFKHKFSLKLKYLHM